jgi:lipooligosaccharide transport system ATP-binding protein
MNPSQENNLTALHVTNLHKRYDDKEVVCGIDFSVPRGTCFGLLGPNGAGKTTTLRCCLGLTAPTPATSGSAALPFRPTRRRRASRSASCRSSTTSIRTSR